jgi:hypothetical protein
MYGEKYPMPKDAIQQDTLILQEVDGGYIEVAMRELQEMSREQGQISILAPLSALAPHAVWDGNISRDKRVQSGEVSSAELHDFKLNILPGFYVSTTPGAPIRCVDGRALVGSDDEAEMLFRPLGPQLAGGSPGVAAALRLTLGGMQELKEDGITILHDVRRANRLCSSAGFGPGAHTDYKNARLENNKTGCGAIDSLDMQLKRFKEPYVQGVIELTKAILQDEYSEDVMQEVVQNARALSETDGSYTGNRHKALEVVKDNNPGAVETLGNEHREFVVVLNYVSGTTLHRDLLVYATDDKLQAFGVDIWAIKLLADEVSDDPRTRSQFLHSKIALDAATLMGLTDGTPKALLRKPVA